MVGVRRFKFRRCFSNLSSTTCILGSTCFGQEPNIYIPFFIREYIQAKYNCQAIRSVPTGVIWLTSPKHCHNYLLMFFICLCQFNFSLRVTPMYVTSFTLLIPIAPTFSAQKSHGMGLFGTQHNTNLVLSSFINLVTMRSRFLLFLFCFCFLKGFILPFRCRCMPHRPTVFLTPRNANG